MEVPLKEGSALFLETTQSDNPTPSPKSHTKIILILGQLKFF